MPTHPGPMPGGTGNGVGYGCACGEHVGWADTAAEAVAATRQCPGPAAPAARPKPAWLARRAPAAGRNAPPSPEAGTPERTP